MIFLLQPWHTNISKRQVKTPKLYFYDVGLATYLLGAESELHVNRHPLRGNLFENLVVIEALKYRYNRGRRNKLHFWRDAKGNEVDLVIEAGPDVVPVEIKSGATISEDYFKGLRSFSAKLPVAPSTCALVYGGTERQQRSDVNVWRVGVVAEMMREIGYTPNKELRRAVESGCFLMRSKLFFDFCVEKISNLTIQPNEKRDRR